MKKSIVFFLILHWAIFAFAQESNLYMPVEISKAYQNGTRSYDGKPGKAYWVNSADYEIDVEFEPQSLLIKGKETITYYNNSPDTLIRIVLKLKQNFYKQGAMRDQPISIENVTDGVKVSNVKIRKGAIMNDPAREGSYGTLFFIRLKEEDFLLPHASITFSLDWELKMPSKLESRSGKAGDDSYFISYWFPQMSVYDDISGWDTQSYTGVGETYNDRANYKVNITVPGQYVVWATGEQLNPDAVFNGSFLEQMNKSKNADSIIHLITAVQTLGESLKAAEKHTWSFRAENVPDFAFALSSDYVWDATSAIANKQTGERAWINIAYPETAKMYKMAAQIAQKAIIQFSNVKPGIAYPYKKQVTFYGDFGMGMEFPMMALDGDMGADSSDFYDLIAHEIAHTYFPFSVNTNEKMYAWMDESWTTIFGVGFAHANGFQTPPFFAHFDKVSWHTFRDLPPMVPTTNVRQLENMQIAYIRPRFSTIFLFEMFEENGKKSPLKEYFSRWEGKHPTPYDYFFTMNNLFGEDLSWYFKPWFFEFCSPDLEIAEVKMTGKNARISIKNPGKMPLPVALTFYFEDGNTNQYRKSAMAWKDGTTTFFVDFETNQKLVKIVLGDDKIPDYKPENNVWIAK